MKYRFEPLLFIAFTVFMCSGSVDEVNPKNVDWRDYGGNKGGSRYSPLTQVNTQNVKDIEVAWTYDMGENKAGERGIDLQCQPIVVNGIMYAVTPKMKLFAVDATNGKELWKFDPFADDTTPPRFHAVLQVIALHVYLNPGLEEYLLPDFSLISFSWKNTCCVVTGELLLFG